MRKIVVLINRTVSNWLYHDAPRIGAAIAFYTLLSFAPLLLFSIAVGSLVFQGSEVEAHLIGEMRQLVGPDGEALITAMIKLPKATGTSSSGIGASLTAAATLLLGASGVLVELRSALNTMWEIPPKGGNGILNMVKDRLLSLGMVLAVGFLLLVSLMVSAILAALSKYLGTFLPFPAAGLEALNFFMSLGGTTILFALVFRYVPDAGLPWLSIWYGAVTTALLFTIGKSVIGIYLGRAGLGSPYGAAGSIVVLIVWIYYSAQIFLLGAEFTQQLATSEEKPHAMPGQRCPRGPAKHHPIR